MKQKLGYLKYIIFVLFFSQNLLAQIQVGEVVLEKSELVNQSYKERRGKHGALIGVQFEDFYPSNYYSRFLDAGIGDITNDDRIKLIGIELGYKYNIGIGSLAALVNFAQGTYDGTISNQPRNLSLVRQGLSANFALDALFEEPYVVPYVQGGMHQFLMTESAVVSGQATDQSSNTSLSFNYKVGLLFQIDFIESLFDKKSKEDRINYSSLENTFLDVYMTEYLASGQAVDPNAPNDQDEPNMASSMELGLGLKLEF